MARGGLVEGGADHLAAHAALHVGDFLRTIVDQQHDERDLRVVGGDGVGDALQEHGLAGVRRLQNGIPFSLRIPGGKWANGVHRPRLNGREPGVLLAPSRTHLRVGTLSPVDNEDVPLVEVEPGRVVHEARFFNRSVLVLELDRLTVGRDWPQGKNKGEPAEYELSTGDSIVL